MKASLVMKATCEWVAVFTCPDGHFFSLLLADVASHLGMKERKVFTWKDLARKSSAMERFRQRHANANVVEEPPGWWELQELARREKDPRKLGQLIDRMNELVSEYEKGQQEKQKRAAFGLSLVQGQHCWQPEIS